ncbi:MAG: hypothetical protein EBV15_00060 [Bacteroidetes bacterium]|nr:hypothetical protein [Bacteroidota bacterium]
MLKAKRYKQPEVDNSEDCYVLGNGPSLSKLLERTPDFFDKKHVCVVNGFAATDVYQKIQPKSYFIKDGLFFWIDEGEFNDPENTWREKKSSGEKNGVIMVANTIKAMKEKTRWPMYLYVPVWAKDSILVREISQNIGNAILGGGADSHRIGHLEVGDDNLVYMVHHHFYDKAHAKTIISDRDKFGNYVAQPLWKQFDNLKKLFYGFSQVKLYADYKNCKIINTSKESFIDAFERDYTIE